MIMSISSPAYLCYRRPDKGNVDATCMQYNHVKKRCNSFTLVMAAIYLKLRLTSATEWQKYKLDRLKAKGHGSEIWDHILSISIVR